MASSPQLVEPITVMAYCSQTIVAFYTDRSGRSGSCADRPKHSWERDFGMTKAVNSSEQFVYEVCRKSFLSIWSYVNPQGRSSKELCDILVVCDPHVLVISVKDVALSDSGNLSVDRDRWKRKAIDASIRQIKGAIRWLDSVAHVVQKDGTQGLPLPALERRIYHRIAVAFGGQNKVPIAPSSVPDDKTYHLVDEQSFYLLLRHLDTISDFVEYLGAKEALLARTGVLINGGEENLLGMYLHAGRKFPEDPNTLIVEGDIWDGVSGRPEFRSKLDEDKVSYVWDRLIESFCIGGFEGPNWRGPGLSETETALRVMARENRFSRRFLGKAFRDFLELVKQGRVSARCAESQSGVGYVFFAYDSDTSAEERKQKLIFRCLAALCGLEHCSTIVGIDINKPGEKPREGYTSDLVMLRRAGEQWPEEFLEKARFCRDKLGYFRTPEESHVHLDEYPDVRNS